MLAWHKGKKADKVGRRIPNYPVLIVIWVLRFIQTVIDIVVWVMGPLLAAYKLLVCCNTCASSKEQTSKKTL
jgi:hypothetical protein